MFIWGGTINIKVTVLQAAKLKHHFGFRNTCFRILLYIMSALGKQNLEFDVHFCHRQLYQYFSACWNYFFLWFSELRSLVNEWTLKNRARESGLAEMLKGYL